MTLFGVYRVELWFMAQGLKRKFLHTYELSNFSDTLFCEVPDGLSRKEQKLVK